MTSLGPDSTLGGPVSTQVVVCAGSTWLIACANR